VCNFFAAVQDKDGDRENSDYSVMAGLVPAIHVFLL